MVITILRQFLKIPRFGNIVVLFKRTLALLTSSMLLSLERANAEVLLFTRLIATLPKSFYFFSIAQPAMLNQKKVEIFLAKFHKSLAKQFQKLPITILGIFYAQNSNFFCRLAKKNFPLVYIMVWESSRSIPQMTCMDFLVGIFQYQPL